MIPMGKTTQRRIPTDPSDRSLAAKTKQGGNNLAALRGGVERVRLPLHDSPGARGCMRKMRGDANASGRGR